MTLSLASNLTPKEGYRRASYQRPGVVIIMGPTMAREERSNPVDAMELLRLPGEWSWAEYLEQRRGDRAP